MVVGEFPGDPLDGGFTDTQLYEFAHAAGFDGAWGWALNANEPTSRHIFPHGWTRC